MTWLAAILLAALAFAVAVVLFRLPRVTWTSLLAALVFGLAGYTLQASPDIEGEPRGSVAETYQDEWEITQSRKALVGTARSSGNDDLLMADAFARRGQFEDAAGFLGNVLRADPENFEAWVALGNVLTEQADGVLTQASVYAYTRANELAPENPAPGYFLGLSLIRQGRLMEARQVWRSTLDRMGGEETRGDDEARVFLSERVSRLDEMLTMAGAVSAPETVPQAVE